MMVKRELANCHMKCPVCREHVERVKHVATVEVRPAGNYGDRYGMIYMHVGKDRIGKKYRVILEEIE